MGALTTFLKLEDNAMKNKEKKKAMKLMIEPSLLHVVRQHAKNQGISMNAYIRKCIIKVTQMAERF